VRPLISIGLPVFNGERYLKNAIESILGQSFKDFELIICDNASTDDTEDICRHYAAKDKRIRYMRNPQNKGSAFNFNKVFWEAKGKYFRWNCYDDYIHPDLLKICLEYMQNNPGAVLYYSRAIMIDQDSNVTELYTDKMDLRDDKASKRMRKYFQAYKGHHMCNPVFGIFETEFLKNTGVMGAYLSSDMVLLGETAMRGKIFEIPEYLFYYRVHPDSSMNAYNTMQRMAWFDPCKDGKLFFMRWRWLKEYFSALNKTDMSLMQKTLCSIEIFSWALRNSYKLSKEIARAIAWPVVRRKYIVHPVSQT